MENNVVLYRKYRPGDFSEVVGQEPIVTTLKNSLASGAVSHAYLFCGPRGSGKTTMARIFAKAVNCQAKKDRPCNECDSCLQIASGKSMDLVEIDAASHTGVDQVRELIDGLKFAPIHSKYKIFIIDECHQLSKSAANALLKTLEEPPSHAIFILATTEIHKMIPTIISRCQRFDFKRLHVPEIIQKLEFIAKKENTSFDQAALGLIALQAHGSFRDAESLLEKCIQFSGKTGAKAHLITVAKVEELLGIVQVSKASTLVDLILKKNTKEAIIFLHTLVEAGVDLGEFTKTLVFYLRQMLLLKISPDFLPAVHSGLSKEELKTINEQVGQATEKNIQAMLESFIGAQNAIKYSLIPQLPLELAVISLTQETPA